MSRGRPFYELTKYNPRPAWRWERACDLIDRRMNASRVRDDELTCELVGFRRAQLRAYTNCSQRRLSRRFPHILAAHELACGWSRQKLELEARVLARQSIEQISLHVSLAPETVQAFEDAFFDVRTCLHATTYIVFKVCGMPMQPCKIGVAWDVLFKMNAYFHGPHAVDAWLRSWELSNGPNAEPPDLSTADGRFAKRIDLLLKLHNLPVPSDPKVSFKLAKSYPILEKIMQPVPQPRRVCEIVAQGATKMLDTMPWSTDKRSPILTRAGHIEGRKPTAA